jgi:hypothetical protein
MRFRLGWYRSLLPYRCILLPTRIQEQVSSHSSLVLSALTAKVLSRVGYHVPEACSSQKVQDYPDWYRGGRVDGQKKKEGKVVSEGFYIGSRSVHSIMYIVEVSLSSHSPSQHGRPCFRLQRSKRRYSQGSRWTMPPNCHIRHLP